MLYLYGLEYVMLLFFMITSVFFWIRYTDKSYSSKVEDISYDLEMISASSGYATLYDYDDGFLNLNTLTPESNESTLYI